MVQIAFLTLLLGLVSGKQPIELSVSGPVAAVTLELDGVPVGGMTAPPWVRQVSFGPDLLPHELVARALGEDGVELARVRQWVNLPRPPAEVTLALEGGGEAGPAAVRLAWQTLVGGKPTRISLTLDGQPLAVSPEGRAVLPPRAGEVPHVLSAEIEFGPGIAARRDVVFGAGGGEAFGELTAVPVRVKGADLPPPERMQGWFTAGGSPLRVVAVENAPGRVVVVREAGVRALLAYPAGPRRGIVDSPGLRLGRGDQVRFLWPKPRLNSGSGILAELFDSSQDFNSQEFGLHFLLSRLTPPDEKSAGQRLADAVAVAGLQALAGNRARAVLLVLGPKPVDGSRYDPAAVRRYLAALRVPLHVWSLASPSSSPAAAAWLTAEDISTEGRLVRAIARLREDLASQRMVFVEGLHLPQSIALSPAAVGVELP